MNDLWIKDIMTQKFLNSDITRLLMINAMIRDGSLMSVCRKSDIIEYIYRVYTDYEDIRKINPDSRIRNIKRYGISDIRDILETSITIWKSFANNNCLLDDDRFVYIQGIDDEKEMGKYTQQIISMLSKKYFSLEIKNPFSLDANQCKEDEDLDIFGKSIYRNRVFEDVQYCPLCEEVDTEQLYVVHITPAKYGLSDEELVDKNNGLIMCRKHAKDYLEGRFCFRENGFVKNINSDIVSENMHLAISVKTRPRREYLKKYFELLSDR